MQVIILWKIWHHQELLLPSPRFMLPSVSDLVVEMWVKLPSEFNTKYPGGIAFRFMPTLYRDHENFGKITTIFSEIFIKTYHPEIKTFFGKILYVTLFNNCFPFSIKITVKYNTVLLVVH